MFTVSLEPDPSNTSPNIFHTQLFYSEPLEAKRTNLKRVITLAGVCNYWRHITTGTCALWSYIPVTLTIPHTTHRLAETHTWLDRALATPLEISINVAAAEYYQYLREADVRETISLLSFDSKRIGSLHLAFQTSDELEMVVNLWFSHCDLKSLTILDVSVRRGGFDPSAFLDWLQSCQALEKLRLAPSDFFSSSYPRLPKLLDLQLCSNGGWIWDEGFITRSALVNWLRACPGLQKLELKGVSIKDIGPLITRPFTLKYLKTVVFRGVHYEGICRVISLLSSKASSMSLLISASNLNSEPPPDNLYDTIEAFSRRSTITALHFKAFHALPARINWLVRALPDMQTISLVHWVLDETVIRSIEEEWTTSLSLKTIYLGDCDVKEVERLEAAAARKCIKLVWIDGRDLK
ncbi:hypothetical protein BDV93DRAFT_609321 [Ceratobasidium sp. AG-I]|nr:hypothetical protein BDV93DRAFT_609321 [Ceratobasidium sp. AG-I]